MADPWTVEQDPYDPRSIMKRNVQGYPLDSDSDAKSDRFRAIIATASRIRTTELGEGPTIYVGDASAGHATYTFTDGGDSFTSPAPPGMLTGQGSDRPMIVLCRSNPAYGTYTEIRCWQPESPISGTTVSCSGVSLHHYNNDESLINPVGVSNYWSIENPPVHRSSGNGRESNGEPREGGGAGNGLSYFFGIMQREHLDYFIANGYEEGFPYAIRFAYGPNGQTVNGPVSSSFRAPATKSDQFGVNGSGIVPMGQFFRLPLSVDPATRFAPGYGADDIETIFLRAFIVTLQKRGIMVADGSGGGPIFYAESERTAGWYSDLGMDDYDAGGSPRGLGCILRDNTTSDGVTRDEFSGVPWSLLEAVDTTVENSDPYFGGSGTEAPAAPVFFNADILPAGWVRLTAGLTLDSRRDQFTIVRRTIPRTAEEPELGDVVVLEDAAAGATSGNTDTGGTPKTSPGSEIKLVQVTIPAPGTYPLRVYCDGAGSAASGSALWRGIAYPTFTPDDKPDGGTLAALSDDEITVAKGDPAEWRTVDLTFEEAGVYWCGLIVGGTANVMRIPRTSGQAEKFVDTGVTYASPPATCPTTGAGTSRSAIHVVTESGGGPVGGTITFEEIPGVGDHYYTGFAVNLETP